MYKWRKTSSNKCYYCEEHEEMLTHLLVGCQKVQQKIWLPQIKWLENFCLIKFTIDTYIIVFNEYKDSFPELVNTIVLIAKQYIYATKCLEKQLSFFQLSSKINQVREIEKYIAKKNNTMSKFQARWQIYDKV